MAMVPEGYRDLLSKKSFAHSRPWAATARRR